MNLGWTSILPVLIVLSSLVPGLMIFTLREERVRTRTALNLTGVVLKLALVGLMLYGVSQGRDFHFELPFLPFAPLILQGDALSLQFVSLSSVLWLATTVYAIGYLEGAKLRSRFFGYFSLCVSATVGLALMGVALLHAIAGSPEFVAGGYLSGFIQDFSPALILAFVLLITGLGVKAALVPLHGWLPQAMVAPAPVSALLHAVAVVKAGAFGIVRVVYDVFGVGTMQAMHLHQPLLWLAALTIVYGSVKALQQQDIKKRLAYSTVSQVSYVTLGVALMGPLAAVGALVHLVHQGLMKVTLFFAAGNFAESLHVHRIDEMNGIGKRMPLTMAAFTVGALGMMGAPPIAGFISKLYLGQGALQVNQAWVIGVLMLSGILNAAYFLPILYRGWFMSPPTEWPKDTKLGGGTPGWRETHWMLLLPVLFTAALSIIVGVLSGTELSPLNWAQLIVNREFDL